MKIRTSTQLFDLLDEELAWRKRELISFKLLIDNGRPHQAETLRRAGVALMYAHWEGFVKRAGTAYVELVANRRLMHRQLKPNFLALAIKAKLQNATATARASIFNDVADYFVSKMDETAKLLWDGSVQTKSNLSAERFKEILLTLGLDYTPYEPKEKLVIERLRESRNSIAHGRYLSVGEAEYDSLHKEVLGMMEEYHGQIETAVATDAYRR